MVEYSSIVDIDTSGIDAAVAEDVGELGNVFFDAVEHPGKQMPQVVRKDLSRVNIGLLT